MKYIQSKRDYLEHYNQAWIILPFTKFYLYSKRATHGIISETIHFLNGYSANDAKETEEEKNLRVRKNAKCHIRQIFDEINLDKNTLFERGGNLF